jgi:hypothetical protein
MNEMSEAQISFSELGKLLMDFQEKRLRGLPAKGAIQHEFSENFEHKMGKLIRHERKPYYPLIKTKARAAIVVVILILFLLTTTAFAIEPIRNKVFDFFLNIFEEFSIVTVDGNKETEVPTSIIDQYEPGYLPEGYVFSEENKTNDFITTYYVREEPFDEISLTQSTKQSFTPIIDTEGVSTTETELSNGLKGFYCTNKGVSIMILHNEYYAFMISSQGDLDALIKFAESITIQK